ncbi:MAG: efflux RND transporter periplasmic adaptor subunit [Microbacter sp.]
MKNQPQILLVFMALVTMIACSSKKSTSEQELPPKVEVQVCYPMKGSISSYVTINGKTVFLKKNVITAPFSGYISSVLIHQGDRVSKNQPLFMLETKEERALSTMPHASVDAGRIKIVSPLQGFISDLAVSANGTYVVEGTPLATVSEDQQATILLNLPYEYHALVGQGSSCTVMLPDRTTLKGLISKILPTIDPVSQTQTVYVRPLTNRTLPENLNVTVRLLDATHHQTWLVPKNAVLTNETQDHFWVMKVVHDTLAVKVPIEKGIENDSIIEIRHGAIQSNDPVITEGNYGLADSTAVKIVH